MEKRAFGQTGLNLSEIGLGTVKFGRNQGVKYPSPFELPDMQSLDRLLKLSQDLGINTLDTAASYGTSEERLGELLKNQRQDWIIVGKAGEEFEEGLSRYDFSPSHFKKSLERSLKRLNTDYIDIFLIHSDGSDIDILNNDDLLKTLIGFRERGLVRAVGASTKTIEGGIKSVDLLDCVMMTYNIGYRDEEPVLEHALKSNKGVLIKKALGSGHIDSSQNPLRFVMDHPGVTSVIVGTINHDHLRSNVESLSA